MFCAAVLSLHTDATVLCLVSVATVTAFAPTAVPAMTGCRLVSIPVLIFFQCVLHYRVCRPNGWFNVVFIHLSSFPSQSHERLVLNVVMGAHHSCVMCLQASMSTGMQKPMLGLRMQVEKPVRWIEEE